jgi:hypothetical protein
VGGRDPARRGAHVAEADGQLAADLARQLDRFDRTLRAGGAVGVDHRAQQARADRHQVGDPVALEHPFHRQRRRARVLRLEREHRHVLADPERAQPRLQILGVEVARERLREHVADHAALEHLVAFVHQLRERALGDRDERQLVGNLEQRERALAGRCHERRRHALVRKARAEAEPRDVVVGEAVDQFALALRAVELHARRQQQLAAFQPRGGVDQLGAVHPPHVRAGGLLA